MNNRLQWLDIAKGFGIVLMVLGHSSLPELVSNFIFSFHMPLFFISSGLTTNFLGIKLMEFIRHKLEKLIIPFLLYSVVVSGLIFFISDFDFIQLFAYGWEGYALWFVPVLFISLIIFKILLLWKSELKHSISIVILLFIGIYLSYSNIRLPWTLSTVPYAVFLIFLGFKCKNIIHKVTSLKTKQQILLFIPCFIVTLIVSFFWRLDLAWNHILPVIPLTIGAVLGTIMLFLISLFVEKQSKLLAKIFNLIGRETLIILSFSQIIIVYINHYYTVNIILKFLILIICLMIMKFMKDMCNKILNIKLL